jgi:hypothetical protein
MDTLSPTLVPYNKSLLHILSKIIRYQNSVTELICFCFFFSSKASTVKIFKLKYDIFSRFRAVTIGGVNSSHLSTIAPSLLSLPRRAQLSYQLSTPNWTGCPSPLLYNHFAWTKLRTLTISNNNSVVGEVCLLIHCLEMGCIGWSRGNACFSHKNNFVDFQDKIFLITQKRRYINAFFNLHYIWKMSVRFIHFLYFPYIHAGNKPRMWKWSLWN